MPLILILIVFTFIFLKNRTIAQTISNNYYTIQGGDIEQKTLINPQAPQAEPPTYTAKMYSGENYHVITGFENIQNSDLFSFSVSDNLVDYGPLTPTNPVFRTTDLIISKGSSRSYSVFAFEDHEIRDPNNNFIPDITCDNGACSETVSAQWSSNLSFGFGYRCEEVDSSVCTEDFSKAYYFKQFANDSKSESPQAILNGSSPKKKAKIKYKVNISGNQNKSNYSNSIIFIAVPNL